MLKISKIQSKTLQSITWRQPNLNVGAIQLNSKICEPSNQPQAQLENYESHCGFIKYNSLFSEISRIKNSGTNFNKIK